MTISAREGQGGIVIEVADTGIGISADDLPRLGTPFVQADADINRRYEGTGLGLSVVKGLVHLHGGTPRDREQARRGHDRLGDAAGRGRGATGRAARGAGRHRL